VKNLGLGNQDRRVPESKTPQAIACGVSVLLKTMSLSFDFGRRTIPPVTCDARHAHCAPRMQVVLHPYMKSGIDTYAEAKSVTPVTSCSL
jgi:hypothetical protein